MEPTLDLRADHAAAYRAWLDQPEPTPPNTTPIEATRAAIAAYWASRPKR